MVQNEYNRLVQKFGSEFEVLLNVKTDEIAKISGEKVAEGVLKVRSGDLVIDPGYDGVFGTVKIWPLAGTRGKPEKEQMSFF